VNGGETFSSWYNQPTAQFYHVSTDNAFPYRVCGGQQESGSACVASRGNYGEIEPALLGQPERIELTRAGFANPQAEVRATLERVGYAFTDGALQRVSYAVLDRAPTSAAQTQTLASVDALRLRYLDGANRWSEAWPPRDVDGAPAPLPRAIELRIDTKDYGEITRIVELVSPWPARAVEATP